MGDSDKNSKLGNQMNKKPVEKKNIKMCKINEAAIFTILRYID